MEISTLWWDEQSKISFRTLVKPTESDSENNVSIRL